MRSCPTAVIPPQIPCSSMETATTAMPPGIRARPRFPTMAWTTTAGREPVTMTWTGMAWTPPRTATTMTRPTFPAAPRSAMTRTTTATGKSTVRAQRMPPPGTWTATSMAMEMPWSARSSAASPRPMCATTMTVMTPMRRSGLMPLKSATGWTMTATRGPLGRPSFGLPTRGRHLPLQHRRQAHRRGLQ